MRDRGYYWVKPELYSDWIPAQFTGKMFWVNGYLTEPEELSIICENKIKAPDLLRDLHFSIKKEIL